MQTEYHEARHRARKARASASAAAVGRSGQDLRPRHQGPARARGGYHKVGFEGGQMPLQRRLPKIGFRSAMKASRAEVTLGALARIDGGR